VISTSPEEVASVSPRLTQAIGRPGRTLVEWRFMVLAPASFPLELAQEPRRAGEMIVENAAGHAKELADERIAQRVSHRRCFLFGGDDVVIPQHGQLLRHDWLFERQRVLELVDRPAPLDEHLEDPDSDGMRERPEEARFERLELAPRRRRRRLGGLPAPRLLHGHETHYIQILL
jgi:hypothetical protein